MSKNYQPIYVYIAIDDENCRWFEFLFSTKFDREDCDALASLICRNREQVIWNWSYQAPKGIYCETNEMWD